MAERPIVSALQAPRLPSLVGQKGKLPARRGRRFLIPTKVQYGLAGALGLAQKDGVGSTGRGPGLGGTPETMSGGKECQL